MTRVGVQGLSLSEIIGKEELLWEDDEYQVWKWHIAVSDMSRTGDCVLPANSRQRVRHR